MGPQRLLGEISGQKEPAPPASSSPTPVHQQPIESKYALANDCALHSAVRACCWLRLSFCRLIARSLLTVARLGLCIFNWNFILHSSTCLPIFHWNVILRFIPW